jgi:hypothetical protein
MNDLTARLEAAALSMAGPGPIKDRLTDAYSHLQDLEASELPELGDEFAEMIKALHRERPLPGDDVVRASVRKLSNADVRHYADGQTLWHGCRREVPAQRSAQRDIAAQVSRPQQRRQHLMQSNRSSASV